MKLIDTHLHLIYLNDFQFPWMEGLPALQKPLRYEDFESVASEVEIEAALFMEMDVPADETEREALFFSGMAARPETRLAGVIAKVPPESEDFEAALDRVDSAQVKAIRRVLHMSDDSLSQSDRFRHHVGLLGARKLPFDLCLRPDQLEVGLALVDACPETTFVLDHCGNPDLSAPESRPGWEAGITRYAERDNVMVKLSGMLAGAPPEKIGLELVKPYLDHSLACFGAERAVWGSDWPVCTLTSSLTTWVGIFREWLGALSEDEQIRIGRSNAGRIYNVELL